MRIVILGDYHMHHDHLDYTAMAMDDIRKIEPDLVVPLGDFGSNDLIGSAAGLQQAYAYLSTINAPIRPILGNHDLERESGDGPQAKGTIEEAFRAMYQLPASYGVLEFDTYRLFFLSTEAIPEDECIYNQVCYTADQYEWVVKKLAERPNIPCIFFSHAPPVGCGLITVPEVHVRVTNAYLDQNHDPHRWFELYRANPQIVMWFSAHYHLGHNHPHSMTERFGTRFFMTGVHGAATRDGKRQSRVVDIEENAITVRTLDHRLRTLISTPDWQYPFPLRNLMKHAEPSSLSETTAASCTSTMKLTHAMALGVPGSDIQAIIPVNRQQLFVQNREYLWEVDLYTSTVMGSLQYSKTTFSVIPTVQEHKYLWLAKGSSLTRIDLASPRRFVRQYYGEKEALAHTHWDIGVHIAAAAFDPARTHRIWIASGGKLHAWDTEHEQLQAVPADVMNGAVTALFEDEQHDIHQPCAADGLPAHYALIHAARQDAIYRVYAILPASDENAQPELHIWEKTFAE